MLFTASGVMIVLRAFFLHHRRWASLLVAVALCMKALVPAGYMLGSETKLLTVRICADSIGQTIGQPVDQPVFRQIAIPQSGHSDKGKADSPCHFTALGHAALGGTDPIQLALALLLTMALGFAPLVPAAPRRLLRLRPPLRGPPALA